MSELKQRARHLLAEIKTQDNRCTRTPIYYEIHSHRWQPCPDGTGDDNSWFNHSNVHVIYGREDALSWCQENYDGILDICDDSLEAMMEEMGYDDKGDCEYVFSREERTPIFLTEKEAKLYIKCNSHNLDDAPEAYIRSGCESDALKTLIEVLEVYCKEASNDE